MFGLYSQSLPGQPVINLSTLSSNLLNSPWFYTEIQQQDSSSSSTTTQSNNNNNKNHTNNNNNKNHTSRLNYHHHQQLLMNTMKVVGTASKLAISSSSSNQHTHRNNIIKFSRYSTMSTLESFNKNDIDNGIFLGLCRVLVVNQYTVTTDIISDVDISIAIQKGCDCIYSSSR